MKTFQLTPDMLTMSGVFYPKGYAFVMFPSADDALQVAHAVDSYLADHPNKKSHEEAVVMLLTPQQVLRDIGKTDGESDVKLPSIGTEGATVNKYIQLAREGHSALMVKVHSDEETEHIMAQVRNVPFSYGQRYHLLAMEDLE